MFRTCVLLFAIVLLSSTSGAGVSKQPHSYITEVTSLKSNANKVDDDDICSLCIEFATQAIQALLQLILQVGVTDTCGDLCAALGDKTSQAIGFVCTVLCDVVGITEFIHIVQRDDIDPIYYCELIPACPIKDNGDAKFTTFEVDPKSGPQGIFMISFEYVSYNGTGTGEIVLDIDAVDGLELSQSFLHEIAPAGTYDGTFQLQAEKDPNCDPTAEPCERWLPGNYTIKIAICNGECGSKHPHSAIYDEATAMFTITKKKST